MITELVDSRRLLIQSPQWNNKGQIIKDPITQTRTQKINHKYKTLQIITTTIKKELESSFIHVNAILVIDLLLKLLGSLGIEHNPTKNVAHLWLPHFELQRTEQFQHKLKVSN